MEIYLLKTFVVVAREGSITRAAEHLHLSQPALSAHIKTLEEILALALFERTPKGMSLTIDGQRILAKAVAALSAHRQLLEEATRIKACLTGRLRLGVDANSNAKIVARLTKVLSDRFPEVDVSLQQGTSREIADRLLNGQLDVGVYNDLGEPNTRLSITEVSNFGLYLVAPPELNASSQPLDWELLAAVPWIRPASNSGCGRATEKLFHQHEIRPKRIISVDRESTTLALVAAGVGVGLLHSYTAEQAQSRGEVEIISEVQPTTRVLFVHLAERADDPMVSAVVSSVPRCQDSCRVN